MISIHTFLQCRYVFSSLGVFSYFRTLGLKSEASMPLKSLGPVKFLGTPLYLKLTHLNATTTTPINGQVILLELGKIEDHVIYTYRQVDYTLQ